MKIPWAEFLSDETGQDMVEYVLLAGVVAVAAGSVFPPIASSVAGIYDKAISVLEKFS